MNIAIPFAAVTQQPVPSAGFNNNFTEVATKFNTYAIQTDVAKVITVGHQWNAAQTYGADILFGDGLYDIGKAGATRPRDLFLSRNLDVGGITVHRGDVQFGTDNALDIATTGARARDLWLSRSINVGTVPATVGGIRLQNNMNISARNAGNTADIVLIKSTAGDLVQLANSQLVINPSTGAVTIAGALTLSAGGASFTGDLLFTDALYDIGKTGATRPRDGFFSRNVTIGGGLTTGPITANSNASNGSINLVPVAGDPASPANGDLWVLTAGTLKARLAGATKIVLIQNTQAGYAAFTNTVNRATAFDTTTVTLPQLASRVAAIQADLTAFPILGP